MLNFLSCNLNFNFDIFEVVAIGVNIVTLIVTCAISVCTLIQTIKIHKHSVDIDLYDKRKALYDKINDDEIDFYTELELLYGREYSFSYKNLKRIKSEIDVSVGQMEKLEEFFEAQNLYEKYQELCVQDFQNESNALHDFYEANTCSYYDEITQDVILLNGNIITQKLSSLNKVYKREKEILQGKMKNYISKSINTKIK